MSQKQGLQVFDENAVCKVGITDRLQKILGFITISSQNGSIENEQLENGELWYIFLDAEDKCFNKVSDPSSKPKITKSGKTLSWEFPLGAINCRLMYGVY